jgi:AmpD protein
LHIDAQGWLQGARHCASPNHDDRPANTEVSLLVIHNISLPPEQFGGPWIEDFFCNRLDPNAHPYFREIHRLQVSAHLLIRRDGELVQFVPFDQRAWHAGQSCFAGQEKCNDFSIGIELEGSDTQDFTAAQYDSLIEVTHLLQQRYPAIKTERIAGHSDIAPERKTDPGPHFDWSAFRQQLAAFSDTPPIG